MAYETYEQWKTEKIEQNPYLSIVIPAYNEETRIIPTIGAIASHFSDLEFPWELIITDDGSKDDTVNLVEGLNLANLHVLVAKKNGGKGSAVRRGMLVARGQYILFADADNSTPIEEISKLLVKLERENYQIAVGSRAVAGSQEGKRTFLRHLMSGTLRWIVKNIFDIGVRDTQCGFKLFTRPVARHLYQAQTLMGFSFDLEILYLATKFGYKIAEVPVSWVDSPGSKINPTKEAQRFICDLIKIKLKDLSGRYEKKFILKSEPITERGLL